MPNIIHIKDTLTTWFSTSINDHQDIKQRRPWITSNKTSEKVKSKKKNLKNIPPILPPSHLVGKDHSVGRDLFLSAFQSALVTCHHTMPLVASKMKALVVCRDCPPPLPRLEGWPAVRFVNLTTHLLPYIIATDVFVQNTQVRSMPQTLEKTPRKILEKTVENMHRNRWLGRVKRFSGFCRAELQSHFCRYQCFFWCGPHTSPPLFCCAEARRRFESKHDFCHGLQVACAGERGAEIMAECLFPPIYFTVYHIYVTIYLSIYLFMCVWSCVNTRRRELFWDRHLLILKGCLAYRS